MTRGERKLGGGMRLGRWSRPQKARRCEGMSVRRTGIPEQCGNYAVAEVTLVEGTRVWLCSAHMGAYARSGQWVP